MARQRERGISRPGEPVRIPAAGRICGEQAGPVDCESPVLSRGLCRMHYRRLARGQDLTIPDLDRIGTPSGKGRWGIIDEDAGRVLCHECGRWFKALGWHVQRAHDMDPRSYRLAHGIGLTRPLCAAAVSEALAAAVDPAQLAGRRQPLVARLAADPAMQIRGQRVAGKNHPDRRTGP